MEELKEEQIPEHTGITCDSRKVKPGYAFIAITGFKEDGNKYIWEAIEKGASVIFTEKEINLKSSIPIIKVDNTRTLLGELSAEYYNHPSHNLQLIGITGTNGKTTTTHLIYNLLNANTQKSGLIGTVKVDNGSQIIPGKLTTPDPVNLQKNLKTMVNNKLKYACMEVSSHGIKLGRIAGSQFAIKVGTNISTDHYDLHPDLPDYINVKKRFLKDNNSKIVLINTDNEYLKSFGKIAKNQINYGIESDAAVKAENISRWKTTGTQFTYKLKKSLGEVKPCKIKIRMNLPGKHNIYNALVAVTIGLYLGVSKEVIQKFFHKFNGVWRRMQFIYQDEFTIIDDCAHNPGSYRAVFESVRNMNYKNLYIVNSLRGNRGTKINQENAETISNWLPRLDNCTLYTSNCNEVAKAINSVSEKEEAIFLDTLDENNVQYTHFNNLNPALETVINKADKNDLVLLLGPHAMDHAGDMILEML